MSNRLAYRKFYKGNLSESEYNKILNDFFKFLKYTLLDKGEVSLSGIGTFKVIGKKIKINKNKRTKGFSIDWKKTKEKGKLSFYTNEHTNYRRFKIVWKYGKRNFNNIKLYYIVPKRTLKRELAKKIKTGKEYFYE